MGVQAELEEAAKICQAEGEGIDEYLVRLVETADLVLGDNQELFETVLSEVSQNWLSFAIIEYNTAIKQKRPIVFPPFPEGKVGTENVEQTQVEGGVVKQSVSDDNISPVQDVISNQETLIAQKSLFIDKKQPKTVVVRELVCKNRDWSLSQVREAVLKSGIDCKQSTVDLVYSDTRATLKILVGLGLLS